MAILTGKAIQDAVESGRIKIDPFNPEQLNPNSYNLTIGNTVCTYNGTSLQGWEDGDSILDAKDLPMLINHQIDFEKGFILYPNVIYLASTVEAVGTSHFVPILDGRSSFARLGATAQLSAGFGDIGFYGEWTLEITVAQPLRIYPWMQVCQVAFHTPEGPITRLYNGRYQGQRGPTKSRMFGDYNG